MDINNIILKKDKTYHIFLKMEKFFNRLGFLGLTFFGIGVVGTRFIFVVDGGQRALVFNKLKGLQNHIYGEGMHFMIPIVH